MPNTLLQKSSDSTKIAISAHLAKAILVIGMFSSISSAYNKINSASFFAGFLQKWFSLLYVSPWLAAYSIIDSAQEALREYPKP